MKIHRAADQTSLLLTFPNLHGLKSDSAATAILQLQETSFQHTISTQFAKADAVQILVNVGIAVRQLL